ncbi:MAG: ATP synthase F1 subunit epsilon [Clostridia bacterium]|nr:ATP synthase F1 subunit epsilon [Clostridia bacterium]
MANTETSTFFLVVKTPEKTFFSDVAEELVVETPQGQIGILPNHMPMVVSITAGAMKIKQDGVWKEAFLSDGFMDITQSMVVVLADTAEWPEEIDINRAKRAEQRALERLQGQLSHQDFVRSQAALQRALSRLKVSSHKN